MGSKASATHLRRRKGTNTFYEVHPKKPQGSNVRIEVTWGDAVLDGGMAPVPRAFLEYGHLLGLTPKERWILVSLMGFIYGGLEPNIFPSQHTLHVRTGASIRTIQRIIRKLRRRGLIRTEQRRDTQSGGWGTLKYDITPVWRQLSGLLSFAQKDPAQIGGRRGAGMADKGGEREDTLTLPKDAMDELARQFGAGAVSLVLRRNRARVMAARSPFHYLAALVADHARKHPPLTPEELARLEKAAAKQGLPNPFVRRPDPEAVVPGPSGEGDS